MRLRCSITSGLCLLMQHAMQIDARGMDGEEIQIQMPSGSELSDLVLAGEKQLKSRLGALSSSTRLCFCFPSIFCKIKVLTLFCRKLTSVALFTESAKRIPDLEAPGQKGTEFSHALIEMKSGDWILKVVPWVGGRILSMEHLPSGNVYLH